MPRLQRRISPSARPRTSTRGRVLAVVTATFLVLAACSSSTTESGFKLSEDDLKRSPVAVSGKQADNLTSTVATATVPEVYAQCETPDGIEASGKDWAGTSDCNTETAEDQPNLSPIPSEEPNVSSALAPGGYSFANPTFFENPLVFLVTEDYGEWLRVLMPTRPNQQEGWIKASDVTLETHDWHAQINVTNNSLKVWKGDDIVIETGVIDGTDATPTPLGRFYFNEKVPGPSEFFGPWVFSTNGYSESLETFDGGLPVFAVHGTSSPDQVGQNLSNGCVRVPNEFIEKMSNEVPMGTPVNVVA